jgi:peptide/nickel transport system permease protein
LEASLKFIRRLRSNLLAFWGAIVILLLVLIAIFAPWIAPQDPFKTNTDKMFLPPFTEGYILGSDELGRDVLSRIIYGSRVSLSVSVLGVSFAVIMGGIAGIVAGYLGGVIDAITMRIVDVMFSIPYLLFALAIVGITGRSMVGVAFALAVAYTPIFARICYSATVAVRELGYVEASIAMGAGSRRILWKDILPNVLPIIMVQFSATLSWAILTEAGLGFIGLGVNPPTPSWGLMLSKSREHFYLSPWLPIFPGLAIMITVFAFNLFGDGMRDVLDPRAWQAGE